MSRLSRFSTAPSGTVEDADATLEASDAADVEEDDGGDEDGGEDDADSDEDDVSSRATGAPSSVTRGHLPCQISELHTLIDGSSHAGCSEVASPENHAPLTYAGWQP